MAAGEQSGDLAEIWRKDGIERGTKNGREAGMGTWPLGFELLSFCYDCLRCDDFNVVRFWAGRPSPFTLAFDNSDLTPVAIYAESTLYALPCVRGSSFSTLGSRQLPHPLVGIRQSCFDSRTHLC